MRNRFCFMFFIIISITTMASGALAFNRDSLVWKKCTGCHEAKGGKIAKVEELRTTPEEWAVILDRMSRLYGLKVSKAETDRLLKELCSTQILSPEELDRVSYLNLYNNTQTVEAPAGKEEEKMFTTCVRCHSAGKIRSYRMSEERWGKLREFHLFQVPTVLYQMREMDWMAESQGVLKTLARTQPYGKGWQSPKATPAGSYLVLGYQPGKGNYRGEATIKALGGGEFGVSGTLSWDDGSSEVVKGEGTLYGGHAFRTRLTWNGLKSLGAFSFTGGELKGEQHFPAPDYRTSQSGWYPVDGKARVLRATPGYLLAGEKTTIRLEGVGLSRVKPEEISCSDASVQILSARSAGAQGIELSAIYKGEGAGKAEFRIPGAPSVPVTLAKEIDRIKVTPEVGRARLYGGKRFPAEGVQFEAVAYAGETPLGAVPAKFTLAAQHKRPDDDDLQWIGRIGTSGKYIPVGTYDQIESRDSHTEGSGLVDVEAEYSRGGRSYKAKGLLAVTLPDFVPRIR